MANESIQLRAQAKLLGIDGYKAMSQEDLKKAIAKASKSSGTTAGKTAARKSSPNGRKPAKTASKTAGRKTAAKPARKPVARKAAPARKTTPKSAPAKRTTAKRPTTQGRKAPAGVGRVLIDNSSIDWTAESAIGQSGGNRQVIMKALRSKKGDTNKVFALLVGKAQQMYGKTQDNRKRSKVAAEALLRWHISRVKFDFVKDTGQHNGVVRSKGTSARVTPKKTTGGKKSAPAKRTPQTAARKPAAKKVAGKRAPAKKTARKTARR